MKQVEIEEALKLRYPEIVANIVTKSLDGKIDITPIGWLSPVSLDPPTWAICLDKEHFSRKAILETKEFTLCLPSAKQKEDVLFCGAHSGWDTDKLTQTKFKTLPAEKVSTPLLDDSLACFECKLIDTKENSDVTIFFGEIVAAHISGEKRGLANLGPKDLIEIERGTKS